VAKTSRYPCDRARSSSYLAKPVNSIELGTQVVLSPDEQLRAAKFKLEIHRHRFIIARALLRQILARYLPLTPERIAFIYSDRGKPSLVENYAYLQFNLSHSENLVLYAFTYQKRVGIDLEYLVKHNDLDKIAKRFFAEREVELILRVEERERTKLFLQLWTAKEAYLKATGEGIAGSLAGVEIGIDRNNYPYFLDRKKSSAWQLQQFCPSENYLATVAVEATNNLDFQYWQL
jgi:4'-phosphopantetheinyl transferase